MLMAGYMHSWFIGTVSMYYLMNLAQSFFGNGNFAVVFPYMVELWPANLRASGFGLVYGISNLGKFIGPAGLAVIAGASNFISPQATMNAIVPAFIYFAAWYSGGSGGVPADRHRDARADAGGTRYGAGEARGGEAVCAVVSAADGRYPANSVIASAAKLRRLLRCVRNDRFTEPARN